MENDFIELQALISDREGYIAANQSSLSEDKHPPYGKYYFDMIAKRMRELKKEDEPKEIDLFNDCHKCNQLKAFAEINDVINSTNISMGKYSKIVDIMAKYGAPGAIRRMNKS